MTPCRVDEESCASYSHHRSVVGALAQGSMGSRTEPFDDAFELHRLDVINTFCSGRPVAICS